MPRRFPLLLIPLWLASPCQADVNGFHLPPGFSVTEYAGDDLVHDCYTLTINPQGQVVVAGRGYIRTLIGMDRAERAVEIADHPKDGAMGLLWERNTLWAVGDGGLRRFTIGPDGKPTGPSELVYKLKTGGEHDAHALRRGPDGWLYLLCGNETGVGAKDAKRPTSPIHDPVAGAVLRFPPDMTAPEVVADGFRNPYGFDFNGDGELFSFDSDNERCVGLPWYEGCRLYHVLDGGHYGWQAPQRGAFWRMPPYFPDVVAPLADLGRGSPTGVVCYRHRQFPEKYRGGLFLGDWTFGRIYFVSLTRSGSTYTAKVETLLESVGDNGFAPTGLAVHPMTGDLYVSIGGRGTRGAVYRIRYDAGVKDAAGYVAPPLPPLSLEWTDKLATDLPKRATTGDESDRRRALDLLWRHREHFSESQIRAVIKACVADGDRPFSQAVGRLVALQNDPFTEMQSIRLRTTPGGFTLGTIVGPFASRWPGAVLSWALSFDGPWEDGAATDDRLRFVQLALGGIGDPKSFGTVWEGYTPRKPVSAEDRTTVLAGIRLVRRSTGPERDRERARLFATLADDDPKSLAWVAAKLTAESHPVDDFHYLICVARITAPRTAEVRSLVKNALLDLDHKMTARGIPRDNNWPLRLAEVHAELACRDPVLNDWLVADPDFARPANVVFTRCPGFDRERAARRFFKLAAESREFAWSPELVTLMGDLPAETTRPLLGRLWERGGYEGAVVAALARAPQPGDRAKFVTGLRSPQLSQISLCLDGLEKLPTAAADPAELLAVIRVLRALGESKPEIKVRARVVKRLQALTGQTIGPDKAAWSAWLAKDHPDLAAKLGGTDGVDVVGWQKRLAEIDWTAGDAGRGKAIFTSASCAACHSGGSAVGPDLRGVGGRFGRDDLMTAILQPSKDIAPRYRTVQITTTDGKSYQGLIIYEAPDGVMVQTGPTTTVRLAGSQIESRSATETSLMPAGLLDKLTSAEIADLVAYLRALK
jgi:putative heme-binding domain-containing protein